MNCEIREHISVIFFIFIWTKSVFFLVEKVRKETIYKQMSINSFIDCRNHFKRKKNNNRKNKSQHLSTRYYQNGCSWSQYKRWNDHIAFIHFFSNSFQCLTYGTLTKKKRNPMSIYIIMASDRYNRGGKWKLIDMVFEFYPNLMFKWILTISNR